MPSPYLVPFAAKLRLSAHTTKPPREQRDEQALRRELEGWVDKLDKLQRVLFADDRFSVLLVFQAMDAAGKDSTIRAVLRGVNPAGCHVRRFGPPSREELDHDFLWRAVAALPERGMIGVFNRSHYEEVLAVRVNPELLEAQRLPYLSRSPKLWAQRYESIRAAEQHWARSGTVILKFFLHVSRAEQKQRLVKRLDDPESHWKFQRGDLDDRKKWGDYTRAYEQALAATSRPWAPWYVIPADDKPFMRCRVAELTVRALEGLPIAYPAPFRGERAELKKLRAALT